MDRTAFITGAMAALLAMAACSRPASEQGAGQDSAVVRKDTVQEERLARPSLDSLSLSSTKGFVVAEPRRGNAPFRLYNADGTEWGAFYLGDSSAGPSMEPFVFNPAYSMAVFRCVGQSRGSYQVVVDEANRDTRYIRANDPAFRFQTWEEHLTDIFAVGFDSVSNPVREAPTPEARILPAAREEYYHPVSIQGEWLKVEWEGDGGKGQGWVRWRSGNRLLVRLFYLC